MKQWKNRLVNYLIAKFAPVGASLMEETSNYPTIGELLSFPDGTLGKETAIMLRENGFNLIANYETHDFKHLLLDFNMDAEGEVSMQYFALGNGNHHISTWGVVFIGAFLFPFKLPFFLQKYRLGKQCVDMALLDYHSLLFIPINGIKAGLKK